MDEEKNLNESMEQDSMKTNKSLERVLVTGTFIVLIVVSGIFWYMFGYTKGSEKERWEDTIDTSVLLDCPFCGGEAKVHERDLFDDNEAYVECKECGVSTDVYKCVTMEDAKEQATKAWNRRYQMLIATE